MPDIDLILASSSPFRRELLERLNLPFRAISPDIDETPATHETPEAYVTRLAKSKAEAVVQRYPDAVVIGSDQCAFLEGNILGKPGSHANALRQLQNARGREVVFYTGLSVQRPAQQFSESVCVEFKVGFRELSDQQLEHYLLTEQPYQCAGSFKSEGYGITLFSHLSGDDPTALIGLPLIHLVSLLEKAGVEVV